MADRKMLGLSFTSPAMATVIAMIDPKSRAFLVNDDTSISTIRKQLSMKLIGSKKEKTFIIAGMINLRKLGSKPRKIHVVVCDTPDMLSEFPGSIRIGDARKDKDGNWQVVEMNKDSLHKRIRWSEYSSPIHPSSISKVRSSFVVSLPSPSKRFDPAEGIQRLIDSVEESFKDEFKLGLYRFMAGLIDRRKFSTIRRKAFNKVSNKTKGQTLNNFKVLFSTVQCWMETEEDGRTVSDAYQICAKKKSIKPPIAAARTGANLEILIQLIREIPPSRRQEFNGYKFFPKKIK